MPKLIDSSEPRYLLGVASMDTTHQEFIELVNGLASIHKALFAPGFTALIHHTEKNFAAENQLMVETGFPAIREHMDEHQRVLGELHRIGQKVANGLVLMGRAYVKEQLPGWFHLHAMTMDSALAAHIRSRLVMAC
jgi:hemerythrin-like metal-binding protein